MKKATTMLVLCSVLVVTACVTGVPEAPRIRIMDEAGLSVVVDKRLMLDDNYSIIRSDGTLGGVFTGTTVAGTWKFEDGYFCRTLTSAPERAMKKPYDCQILEISGNKLHGTRDKGNGVSFTYDIEK